MLTSWFVKNICLFGKKVKTRVSACGSTLCPFSQVRGGRHDGHGSRDARGLSRDIWQHLCAHALTQEKRTQEIKRTQGSPLIHAF